MSGLFGALAKATSAFWGPVAGAAVGVIGGLAVQNKASRDAASAEKRNQEYLNESKLNDLSKLRESAEKAGFNPLTAMRAGAGNFQSNTALMPSMSGYQFALESLSTGVEKAVQWKHTYQERALDALYKTTSIQSMQADIALTKAKLGSLGQQQDPYAGYKDFIPVQYGLKKFKMPLDMAQRLGVKPNGYLETGMISELFGEGSEFLTNFASAAQQHMYGISTPQLASGDKAPPNIGNRGKSPTITVEPLDQPKFSKGWFEFFIDNGKTKPNPTVPRVFGVIR